MYVLLVNKAATFITKMFRMLGLDDSGNQYASMAKRNAYMYVCVYACMYVCVYID